MSEIDKSFWEGFDICSVLIINYITESDFFEDYEIANQLVDEIIEETESYRKDKKEPPCAQ